jgi:5'-phosphate synthase pdxT subunit
LVRKRIGVLALQGDVREHRSAIAQSGAIDSIVRRKEDLQSIDALILPGGESTTIGKLLRIFDLFDPLKEEIAKGLPVFGTCAGMILLAKDVIDGSHDQETLATMDVAVRRNAFGRQVDSFETELDLSAIGVGKSTAIFIRAPWIERSGPDVQVLASVSRDSGSHAVLARQDSQLVAAFHPEIIGAKKYQVHEYFIREMAS